MSSQPVLAPEIPPQVTMVNLTTGHWVAQMIRVVAELNIADLLKDGPRTSADLAASTGTNPDALYRLLRALASLEVFAENANGSFQLTPLSRSEEHTSELQSRL